MTSLPPDTAHSRENTKCFRLGEVFFVPHYTAIDRVVGPGGIVYPVSVLEKAGARVVTLHLWPRPKPKNYVVKI